VTLTVEMWDRAMAAVPEGWRFSSLHTDMDRPGVWTASVARPPEPACDCCGTAKGQWSFIIGSGLTPDDALDDLVRVMS
jgi:hypothetical protein